MNYKCTLYPPFLHKNFPFLCPVFLFSLALNPCIYKNRKCYSSKGIFFNAVSKATFTRGALLNFFGGVKSDFT